MRCKWGRVQGGRGGSAALNDNEAPLCRDKRGGEGGLKQKHGALAAAQHVGTHVPTCPRPFLDPPHLITMVSGGGGGMVELLLRRGMFSGPAGSTGGWLALDPERLMEGGEHVNLGRPPSGSSGPSPDLWQKLAGEEQLAGFFGGLCSGQAVWGFSDWVKQGRKWRPWCTRKWRPWCTRKWRPWCTRYWGQSSATSCACPGTMMASTRRQAAPCGAAGR